MEQQPHHPNGNKPHHPDRDGRYEISAGREALERVGFYLHATFADADARGEAIGPDDARVIATLLAQLVGPSSALARFVDTGEVDRVGLEEECRRIKAAKLDIPDIELWIQRLEEHLAQQPNADNDSKPSTEGLAATGSEIDRGVHQHGDAFRAYLQLPDTDRYRGNLLAKFTEFYVGSFDSIDALLNELTDVRTVEDAIKFLDRHWGVEGLISLDRSKVADIASHVWDIVDIDGRLHVFNK